ncbi:glycosyltransferase family 4 protein [bacterium]|nr:glycosyltransferase family 4 protein [bacterium]
MKILIISNYYPPHFKGGYELSCYEVTTYLYEQGEDVLVLCGDYLKNEPDNRSNYRVVRKLKYIDYLSDDYWNKSKVEKDNYEMTTRILDEFEPDFVYFWNQQYLSLAPYWAVKRRKIAHVFDIGDVWPLKYYREGFKAKVKSFIKRLLPNFRDAKMEVNPVIILSEWMRPLFVEKFGSKEIYNIPRGVKLKEDLQINSKADDIKLMFAGRIEPLKGLELIINVLSGLQAYKWTLDVYGDGDEDYLERIKLLITEKSLGQRVILKGKLYPLDEAYQTHDVFLFPTLAKEGFGRVAIEAMSYGLPVLTVNKYGPNDIVEDGYNGYKASPSDLSAWANNLKQILSDKDLLIKMSNNALETVKNKYDIELINKQRYDIIKDIYYSK